MTSSLSINTHWRTQTHSHARTRVHTHTHSDSFTHTHRLPDISQAPWLWVFISLSFSFSSFIILSPLVLFLPSRLFSPLFLFQPYCFSSSLHRSVILFLIQARCFSFCLFLSHINPLSLAPSPSLRLAVFIFQSFISTNVRQCFCPPSIDPQREKEMGRERPGEKGKGSDKERSRKRDIQREEWEKKQQWGKRGKEKAGWKVRKVESLEYFNHSFSQITEQPWTDSGSPLLSPPILSLTTPLLTVPAHSTNITPTTEI